MYKLLGGNSLAVQWWKLQASTAGAVYAIPGGGTKIPHTMQHAPKQKNNEK